MITFRPEFVEIKYPGYFWNTIDYKLYSIKIGGVLKPLKYIKPSHHNDFFCGYIISHEGHKRYVHLSYLKLLKGPSDHIIPVRDEKCVVL